jgi:hypothetical protein
MGPFGCREVPRSQGGIVRRSLPKRSFNSFVVSVTGMVLSVLGVGNPNGNLVVGNSVLM